MSELFCRSSYDGGAICARPRSGDVREAMQALTRPCLPPAWAPQLSRARLARSTRPRLARARRCALLTPLALDPASLAAALSSALGGMAHTAEAVASVSPEEAAAAMAGAVSLSAAALSARDAVAGGGDGNGAGSNGGGGGGGGGGEGEPSGGEGDFWHRNALPSFACALVTVALLRAHEDAAAAAFGWASFMLLLLPAPFTLEVVLVCGVFVYVVRRRSLKAAEEK